MVNRGSTGTPSFKQVVMQKQKAQEGFKITGYGERKENNGTSRERKQQLSLFEVEHLVDGLSINVKEDAPRWRLDSSVICIIILST